MASATVAKQRRLIVGAASVLGHAAVVLALFNVHERAAPEPEITPIAVALVTPPPPPEPPAPKTAEAPPEPASAPPPRPIARRIVQAPPDIPPLPAAKGPSAEGTDELSDAQVASAATAGSGGGGACNMAAQLQAALRKSPLVRAAVAEAHSGRPILVWNGDWVRHGEQDGNGLAALREAIMWEVGFAPEACRREPVHGLVLLSLNDGPGAARIVVGSGDWRWADLLHRRR